MPSTGLSFASFVNEMVGVINAIIPVLVSLALLVFFIGLIKYIYNAGDVRAHTQGLEFIKWGLVALFVLLSVWGILDVAQMFVFPNY